MNGSVLFSAVDAEESANYEDEIMKVGPQRFTKHTYIVIFLRKTKWILLFQ